MKSADRLTKAEKIAVGVLNQELFLKFDAFPRVVTIFA